MKRFGILNLCLALAFLLYSSGFAREVKLNNKLIPINIPYITEDISLKMMDDDDLKNFVVEEEKYIDDIPFDTEIVYSQLMAGELFDQFAMTDEEYIDDIPFDTYEVVASLDLNPSDAELLAKENNTVVEEATITSSFEIRDILIPVIVVLGFMSYLFYAYVT